MVKIAIVDDKSLSREAIRNKLLNQPDIELLFEAKNGEDLLIKLKTALCLPDVILIDIEMPVLNGIDAIAHSKAAYPQIKFIVVTMFEDYDKIIESIKAGACGYILKDDKAVNMIDAIKSAHEYNNVTMSAVIARKALQYLIALHSSNNTNIGFEKSDELTDRELEILKEMACGKNYKLIGEKLFISPLTVRKHAANIYYKLHVKSRLQAVAIAQKKKWF